MTGIETEARTRYSVQGSRNEVKRERRMRSLVWGLIGAALVVIVVFAVLIGMGAGA